MLDLKCISCKNMLYLCATVIESITGPLAVCEICRTTYYLDISGPTTRTQKTVFILTPTKLDPESEYDIIRNAEERIPLSKYLPKTDLDENIFKQEDKLKDTIRQCSTPSELVKRLQNE